MRSRAYCAFVPYWWNWYYHNHPHHTQLHSQHTTHTFTLATAARAGEPDCWSAQLRKHFRASLRRLGIQRRSPRWKPFCQTGWTYFRAPFWAERRTCGRWCPSRCTARPCWEERVLNNVRCDVRRGKMGYLRAVRADTKQSNTKVIQQKSRSKNRSPLFTLTHTHAHRQTDRQEN